MLPYYRLCTLIFSFLFYPLSYLFKRCSRPVERILHNSLKGHNTQCETTLMGEMCCPFPTTRIQTMLLSSLVSSPQESSLPGFSKNVFVCVCVCVCGPCLAHVHVHKGCYLAVKHLHTGLWGGEEPPCHHAHCPEVVCRSGDFPSF